MHFSIKFQVGAACTKTSTDYCTFNIKLGECEADSNGNNKCVCRHGSNSAENGKTCRCPDGYYMKEHLHNPFLPDGPKYTCELGKYKYLP